MIAFSVKTSKVNKAMELAEMIDELLRQSTEARNRHADSVRKHDERAAENHHFRYVTLLHAAKLVDSAMKSERYVETRNG